MSDNVFSSIDELREHLKNYLPDYLIKMGVINSPTDKFECLNPDHQDTRPSMGLVASADNRVAHCFSCLSNYTLYDAVFHLEGYPKYGEGFLTQTLPYLAELFNVEYEFGEISDDELYKRRIKEVYRIVSNIIVNYGKKSNKFIENISNRGWNLQIANKLKIGTILSYNNLVLECEKYGITTEDLYNAGLGSSKNSYDPIEEMFSEKFIIFTITNKFGEPIAFAGRNTEWKKGLDVPKYINTAGSLGSFNIYQKSKTLYGIDKIKNKLQPVYIVEGYADYISLFKNGIDNVVAVCGVKFSEKHVNELISIGCRKYILTLDNDAAGNSEIPKAIEMIKFNKTLNMKILILPDGYKDPDDYILKNGIKKFKEIKPITTFEWELKESKKTMLPEDIIDKMIHYVINEQSPIKREKMIQSLALAAEVSKDSVEKEVKIRLDKKNNNYKRSIDQIVKRSMDIIYHNPDAAINTLTDTINEINELSRVYNKDDFSAEKVIERLLNFKDRMDNGELGNTLNWGRFDIINKALDADVTNGYILSLAGFANCGKSSILADLAIELITLNQNLTIFFVSIDDNFDQITSKLLFRLADDDKGLITINKLKTAHKIKNHKLKKYTLEQREKAFERLSKIIEQQRLIISDRADGATFTFINSQVTKIRKQYPDRKIIVILDNFHKLEKHDVSNSDNERVLFKQLSSKLKDMTVQKRCGLFQTVEYNKIDSSTVASNNAISETGKIIYDSNGIFHLYNDMDARKENARWFHYDTSMLNNDVSVAKLPIIQLQIGKSKDKFDKGSIYFKFFPHRCYFEPISYQEVKNNEILYSTAGVPDDISERRKRYIEAAKQYIDV